MTRYRVFEPAGVEGRSDAALFVADGFSKLALVLPFVWLLGSGLVLLAALVLVADVALGALWRGLGLGAVPATVLGLLLPGLVVALEGSRLRAAKLRRRGWVERAVVIAHDAGEAEIEYYAGERGGALTLAPLPRSRWRALLRRPSAAGSVRRSPARTLFSTEGRP